MIQHTLDATEQTVHLTISSDLVSTNHALFKSDVLTLFETEPIKSAVWNTIRLDLTQVQKIDSVGLGMIISLQRRMKKMGAKTVALVKHQEVYRAFVLTKLNTHIEVILAKDSHSGTGDRPPK